MLVFVMHLPALLTATHPTSLPPAVQHTLEAYPLAKCLDGSPGAYYYRPSSNFSSRSFLFFQEGGGWCYPSAAPYTPEDLDSNCLWRSKGPVGTTTRDPPNITFSKGMLSTEPTESIFSDFHLVFMRYCDGGTSTKCNSSQASPVFIAMVCLPF